MRELHGLTQRELGDIAGVSDKAVSTWEKGTKMPRMGALRNMAKYFGSTVSELLEEPPVKPEKEHPAVKLLSQCCLTRTPEQVATALSISPARIRQLLLGAETHRRRRVHDSALLYTAGNGYGQCMPLSPADHGVTTHPGTRARTGRRAD